MIAVKGIYEGGNTVRIDDSELNIAEPYEVLVSFLQPAKTVNEEKNLAAIKLIQELAKGEKSGEADGWLTLEDVKKDLGINHA
ncbi:MAG: hypothetical protein LBG79_05675 [Spirochaetaceae bacterium]|jgi:hypothetical protein|nr:hypothetical protein [Spirochaetaceae bacterium]